MEVDGKVYEPWEIVRWCVACRTELSKWQHEYSNGVCPYCGHIGNGTFCEVKTGSRRKVFDYVAPLWKILLFLDRNYFHWEYKNQRDE